MPQNGNGFRWQGGFCMEVNPAPARLVVFGANGDLAKRKLLPALEQLHKRQLLHDRTKIVICTRNQTEIRSDDPSFSARMEYITGDYFDPAVRLALKQRLQKLRDDCAGLPSADILYFSLPSDIYMDLLDALADDGTLTDGSRVVLEKPFGRDLTDADAFNTRLYRNLKEEQIFRIDHYLGKETVQNILFFRFANRIFEPVWNREHIESVHIRVSEKLGVENRAKYFDRTGLIRDMFQNHMLELLSLIAMEKPCSFSADCVHDEKVRLFRAIDPLHPDQVCRGQYLAGIIDGREVPAYRSEPGVAADSGIETYVSAVLNIRTPRWDGVPFTLTCGKRMAEKRSEIEVRFKRPVESIFPGVPPEALVRNRLLFSIQPEEGISLTIQAKHPGPKLCMGELNMNFCYATLMEPGEVMPDAYERLLLDVMLDDRMLFIRSDSIRAAWQLLDPVIASATPLHYYPAGTSITEKI